MVDLIPWPFGVATVALLVGWLRWVDRVEKAGQFQEGSGQERDGHERGGG